FVSSVSGQDAANTVLRGMELLDTTQALLERHRAFATFTIWTSVAFTIGWLWLYLKYPGDRRVDVVALAFLLILSLAVGITGFLGGELVLTHGVGVGL
ncbi:MAG: hypothetical protein ACE5GH_06330, partial [Fidelibacterota bacterium]